MVLIQINDTGRIDFYSVSPEHINYKVGTLSYDISSVNAIDLVSSIFRKTDILERSLAFNNSEEQIPENIINNRSTLRFPSPPVTQEQPIHPRTVVNEVFEEGIDPFTTLGSDLREDQEYEEDHDT